MLNCQPRTSYMFLSLRFHDTCMLLQSFWGGFAHQPVRREQFRIVDHPFFEFGKGIR